MHPEFISRISMPESFKKPPSIPISPNSFSIRTTFSPAIASFRSFFINVVFPAPRKPEIISIFVIMTPLSCHPRGIPVFLSVRLNFILYTDQIHCRTFIFHYQLLTLTHFLTKSSTAASSDVWKAAEIREIFSYNIVFLYSLQDLAKSSLIERLRLRICWHPAVSPLSRLPHHLNDTEYPEHRQIHHNNAGSRRN